MNKVHDKILNDWKSKEYAPIYFLHGDEEFFIKSILKNAENILPESEKAFNQVTLYGKEVNAKSIQDQLYQYPMMSSHRLVILKEAQSMRDFDNLKSYFEKPSEQSIFIIAYTHKKVDKRKKAWKSLSKHAVVMESKKIYENKVPSFIKSYLKKDKVDMDHVALNLMVNYLGADLSKISNELDKLLLNIKEGETITPDHIQKYIGINKDYNIFEFNNALASKNGLLAYRIAKYFEANPSQNPIQMILPSVENHFIKILQAKQSKSQNDSGLASQLGVHPFFVKDYKLAAARFSSGDLLKVFEVVEKCDKMSKGIGAKNLSSGEILKEMIYKMLN